MQVDCFPKRIVAWPESSTGCVEFVAKDELICITIAAGPILSGRGRLDIDESRQARKTGYLTGIVNTTDVVPS